MKKIATAFLLFFLLFALMIVLSRCTSGPGNTRDLKTRLENRVGEQVTEIDGWFYYNEPEDGLKIYKIRPNGTGKKKLTPVKGIFEGCDGKWLYYKAMENAVYSLYKVSVNGKDNVKLTDNKPVGEAFISDDYIFYLDTSTGLINRINIEGGGDMPVTDKACSNPVMSGDDIYYINSKTSGNIEKLDIYTGISNKISNDVISAFKIDGENIFYINEADAGKVYRIDTDGIKKSRVTDETVSEFIVSEGSIIYINKIKSTIFSVLPDGSAKTRVSSTMYSKCHDISAAGDWLYFTALIKNQEQSYKLKKDGSMEVLMSYY